MIHLPPCLSSLTGHWHVLKGPDRFPIRERDIKLNCVSRAAPILIPVPVVLGLVIPGPCHRLAVDCYSHVRSHRDSFPRADTHCGHQHSNLEQK